MDIPALYDPDGRYGRWNAAALTTLRRRRAGADPVPRPVALHRARSTKALGGADISWIVGLIVPAVIYYLWASRLNVAPAEMVARP